MISFDKLENNELIESKLTFLIIIYSDKRSKFSLRAPIRSLKTVNNVSTSISLSNENQKILLNFVFSIRMKRHFLPHKTQKKNHHLYKFMKNQG